MTDKKQRKSGSGGARPGAGRTTTEKREHTIRVTTKEKELIEKLRENNGLLKGV